MVPEAGSMEKTAWLTPQQFGLLQTKKEFVEGNGNFSSCSEARPMTFEITVSENGRGGNRL